MTFWAMTWTDTPLLANRSNVIVADFWARVCDDEHGRFVTEKMVVGACGEILSENPLDQQ